MAKIHHPKEFTNWKNIEKTALAGGAEIKFGGNGSHRHIVYKGETMTYPAHDTGIGLATKIFKWMLRVGLIVVIGYVVVYINTLG